MPCTQVGAEHRLRFSPTSPFASSQAGPEAPSSPSAAVVCRSARSCTLDINAFSVPGNISLGKEEEASCRLPPSSPSVMCYVQVHACAHTRTHEESGTCWVDFKPLNVSVRTVVTKNGTAGRLKGEILLLIVPGIICICLLESQQINSQCGNKDSQQSEDQGS